LYQLVIDFTELFFSNSNNNNINVNNNTHKPPEQSKYIERLCRLQTKLESSQSPQTSSNAMLFARWQHHIQFGSGFPYAPLKAMLTKILK